MSISARAREIADTIHREWDGEESLTDFFRRRFGADLCGDGAAALTLCLRRQNGMDDLSAVLKLIVVNNASSEATLAQLIKYRRAKGYSAELETLLARTWICLGCDNRATLLSGVLLPVGPSGGWPICSACEDEIAQIDPEADLAVIDGGRA